MTIRAQTLTWVTLSIFCGVVTGSNSARGSSPLDFLSSGFDEIAGSQDQCTFAMETVRSQSIRADFESAAQSASTRSEDLSIGAKVGHEAYVSGNVDANFGLFEAAKRFREFNVSGGIGFRQATSRELSAVLARFAIAGAIPPFDFLLLSCDRSAISYADNSEPAHGVTEGKMTSYGEKNVADWLDIRQSATVSRLHVGRSGGFGTAEELSLHIGVGKRSWRFHAGPWVFLRRFDSDDPYLSPTLPHRYNFRGAYAEAVLGNASHARGGRVVLSVGSAVDPALAPADRRTNYAEATADLYAIESFALRAAGGRYFGGTLSPNDSATVVAKIMATARL